MPSESPRTARLTPRQKIALRWLLFEGPALDSGLWHEGVSPFPTLNNLEARGLVCKVRYQSQGMEDQVGWERELTTAGREIAEAL